MADDIWQKYGRWKITKSKIKKTNEWIFFGNFYKLVSTSTCPSDWKIVWMLCSSFFHKEPAGCFDQDSSWSLHRPHGIKVLVMVMVVDDITTRLWLICLSIGLDQNLSWILSKWHQRLASIAWLGLQRKAGSWFSLDGGAAESYKWVGTCLMPDNHTTWLNHTWYGITGVEDF